jgi:histidinol-phosphatase (PHP family)
MFDTHVHCEFSCDSTMTLTQAWEQVEHEPKLGMVVTEHWDYEYPGNPEKFIFDREAYFAKYKSMRRPGKLLLGIEVGMQPHLAAQDDAVPNGYAFDYVLGAVHMMDKQDLYYKKAYQGLTQAQAEEKYLQTAIACVESHKNFDAFAHIDYICRYWPYTGVDAELHVEEHLKLYQKLLGLLVERKLPLEFNTRRLDTQAAIKTMLDVGHCYAGLGGRFCTVGSDAHNKTHVCRRLQLASVLAKECGLVPVYFEERKMYRDQVL